MRRAIPIVIGVVLLLLGVGWAAQGAGMMGGSNLMDNNPTFIYLGGFVALVGIALIAFGAARARSTARGPEGRLSTSLRAEGPEQL